MRLLLFIPLIFKEGLGVVNMFLYNLTPPTSPSKVEDYPDPSPHFQGGARGG